MAYGDTTTYGGYEYWEGEGGTFFRRPAGSKKQGDYGRINIGEVPDEIRRQSASRTTPIRRRA